MANKQISIVSLGVPPYDAIDQSDLGLNGGDQAVFNVDDSFVPFRGTLNYQPPAPVGALLTGGYHNGTASLTPHYVPQPEAAEYYRLLMAFKHLLMQGRFLNKGEVHARTIEGGGFGWSHMVRGLQAVRVFFAVLQPKDDDGSRLLIGKPHARVSSADGRATGRVLQIKRNATAPEMPRRPDENIFLTLEYAYALRRGLLIEDGGQVYAMTDNIFLDKAAFVRAVGPRGLQRSLLEPGPQLIRKELWKRQKPGEELPAAFGPIIVNFRNDEDFLLNCMSIWAMGTAQRVANLNTAGPDTPPNGDNPFDRMHCRHTPANPNDDVIGNYDPVTHTYDRDAGDATEMYYAARRLGNQDNDVPEINPWRAEQEAWINDALETADQITLRRMRKEARRGHISFKDVNDEHLEKGFGQQWVGWVRPMERRADDVWVWSNTVMKYADAEAAGLKIFRYGWSPNGDPKLYKLWLRGALADVYFAAFRFLSNRDRDPDPWKIMLTKNIWAGLLGPDALDWMNVSLSEMAQRCKYLDDLSRSLEVAILIGEQGNKQLNPTTVERRAVFNLELVQKKGTPAAVAYGTVGKGSWSERLKATREDKANSHLVAELEAVWKETEDTIWGHFDAGGSFCELTDEDGNPTSFWGMLRAYLLEPWQNGWWNDLVAKYDECLYALIAERYQSPIREVLYVF